jgi:hypothetical protein
VSSEEVLGLELCKGLEYLIGGKMVDILGCV